MKRLSTFIVLALLTITASAQDLTFDFSNFEETTILKTTKLENGVTIYALEDTTVTIVKKSKTVAIDDNTSVNYTKAVNLGGVATLNARHISFDVNGACEITVVCYHGSASNGDKRVLNLSYGKEFDKANLQSIVVNIGSEATVGTVRYEVAKANTIHIGSGYGSVGIFAIYVTYITPEKASPSSDPVSWDFTQAFSDTDLANLKADEKWTYTFSSSYERYSYTESFDAQSVIGNFYGYALKANGSQLDIAKGLCFGRPNGKLDANRFAFDNGKRMVINGTDVGFIIPDLKRGDIIRVTFSTNSNGNTHTLILTNLTSDNDLTSSSSSTPVEVTCTVLSDGYVGFRGSAALYYYTIEVNPTITNGIVAVATTATADGAPYNLAGQKVGDDYKGIVIIDGKKYLHK